MEIKALILHPMETGFRPGPNGRIIPRNIIEDFVCTYNGVEVCRMKLSSAVAANPFISFFTTATETGVLFFRWTGDELPYTSTVLIDKFEQEGRLRRIHASIIVDKDAHKGIVVGAKGAQLKAIGTKARLDMEELFGGKVHLELWVKVKHAWADDRRTLARLGLT